MAKNWAIVVGINQYKHIGHLDYANHDAAAMAEFFRSQHFDEVFWFTDELTIESQSVQQSTFPRSSDLSDFLHDRLTAKSCELAPGDNCWFFFSGHGKRIGGQDYLLPYDYHPEIVGHEQRAIAVESVREALLNSGADNIILLLDACRTASKDGADGIGDEQPGAITIFSCERNKQAYEIVALKHGAFTAALLEGLQMETPENCATVKRLDRYLGDRVPELLRQFHPDKPIQHPKTAVDPGQKWDLLLFPQVATKQDIEALTIQAYKTWQLDKNLDLAELLFQRVNTAKKGADRDVVQVLQAIAVQRVLNPELPTPSPPPPNPPASRSTPPTTTPEPPPAPKRGMFNFNIIAVDATGRKTDLRPGKADYFSEDLGNGVILDMMQIPGGSFLMGADKGEEGASRDEYPQHSVTVPEFWMGKFAVTQAQWNAIAQLPKVKIDLTPNPSHFEGPNRPIETVSWHEAIEFCDRLSRRTRKTYRLPSEAQWEYACRASSTEPFHFRETIRTNLANFNGNYSYAKTPKGEYRRRTIDVGSFPPNAFGLYDMHGNVWEWCMDTWYGSYDLAPNDGSAWIDKTGTSRLIRGGSWDSLPLSCRSAYRGHEDSAERGNYLGFRVIHLPS
jgi:formylglycine-generating enzyme required for sulfatase activity